MERGPGLGVLVRRGRDSHGRPDCVDPGGVDVETEEEVGDGGEEAGGPVAQVVKEHLGQDQPDNANCGVGPDSHLLDSHQFALNQQS